MGWLTAATALLVVCVIVGVLAYVVGLRQSKKVSELENLRREVAILRAEVERLREMVEGSRPEPRDAGSPHVQRLE
jgi:hypothetical protein